MEYPLLEINIINKNIFIYNIVYSIHNKRSRDIIFMA